MRKNFKKYVPQYLRLFSLVAMLLIFSLILTSCTTNNDAGNEVANDTMDDTEDVEPTAVPPTEVPIPDQTAYYAEPHNVYDQGKGPNTACSGCHSPLNWDPEATFGPPPSCWTCKFGHLPELSVAANNPLVEEADWKGIPCETCHEVDANGTASAEFAWLNTSSMEYEEVNTSTELCEKCHVTTTGNAWGSGVDHKIVIGGSAHLNYSRFMGPVAPPQVCTDCHNPHDNTRVWLEEDTTEATGPLNVSCEDCHTVRTLDTHIMGKNAFHTNVSCLACHDSIGYDVGPSPESGEEGLWVTIETTMGRGGLSTNRVVSHSPTHEVLCSKCHNETNLALYGMPEYTDKGAVPEVDICIGGLEDLTIEKPDLGDYGVLDTDYTMGTCPVVDICVAEETVADVLVANLEDLYGVEDVDYVLGECVVEEDASDG